MKIFTKKQLIAIAILSSISQIAIANTPECEKEFGPWCDLANFLEQQEATAAGGPLAENVINLDNINFDSEEFNGQLENNTTAAAPEKIYESYVLLYNETAKLNRKNKLKNKKTNSVEFAKAVFAVDENNQITSLQVTRASDGKTIDLTKKVAGKELVSFLKTNSVPKFTKDLKARTAEREGGVIRSIVGKLTDQVDITDLATRNAIFTYKIKGTSINQANKVGSFTNKKMVVDFNKGSWKMNGLYGTNITNGSISGNTFSSNGSIELTKKSKKQGFEKLGDNSYVSGSFFGSQAAKVAGTANIIREHKKSKNDTNHTILFNSYQTTKKFNDVK